MNRIGAFALSFLLLLSSAFAQEGFDFGFDTKKPVTKPGSDNETWRVTIISDAAGRKYAKIPEALVEGKELSGIQHGIDEAGSHVVFNADENLGNAQRGEFYFPVLEGTQEESPELLSIESFIGKGTFEPYKFDIRPTEGGERLLREQLETSVKDALDETRIQSLSEQFTLAPVPYVAEDTFDPYAWAAWTYYYQQLTYWEDFISINLLNGEELTQRTTYDPAFIKEEVEELYNSHLDQVMLFTQNQSQRVRAILAKLSDRADKRQRFEEWRQAREGEIDQYGKNIIDRQQGTLLQLGEQKFVVTKEPQDSLPSDVINVVTDVLTPYDLLDGKGIVKQKSKSGSKSKY